MNSLVFDKAVEIRFLILKSMLSRFGDNEEFRSSLMEISIIYSLITAQ
jgi:hypothetical protein